MQKINIFWFRRDLRIDDNHGLFNALSTENPVLPIFIFDEEILTKLPNSYDRRVDFIFQALEYLNEKLKKGGKSISYFYGKPLEIFKKLTEDFNIEKVFTNEDYEPSAIKRDQEIEQFLLSKNIKFEAYKDQVVFHKNDVLKQDGKPYTVYTPYSKAWLQKWNTEKPEIFDSKNLVKNLLDYNAENFSLETIGFQKTDLEFEKPKVNEELIKKYDETRNFPYINGTSLLGIHLRFGTISVRKLALFVENLNEVFLKELIWREFFMQILYHFPEVEKRAFKIQYENISWENNEENFNIWKEGKTGFPLVDAGIRELNATGNMHNRVRMVVASFLVKDLLIDWKWGESYFAEKLLDFDLSANNGNWQWCAGSGCDAAPYFRIFNPEEQQKKFDPDFIYIKKWIPEIGTSAYPKPMIEHKFARERTLKVYKEALGNF